MIVANAITNFLMLELALWRTQSLAATPAPRPARRVLVVDDNADAALLMKDVLSEEGCDVEIISDPSKALSVVTAAVPIDQVFMDLHFPNHESGLMAFRKIRAVLPDVPITIVSGFIDDRFSEAAKQLGFEIVKKQDGIKALRDAVRRPV